MVTSCPSNVPSGNLQVTLREERTGERRPACYPVTAPPSGLTGQQEDTGQVRQPGLTRAR